MISKTDSIVVAIIVTYNGENWMDKCLSSLIKSEYPVEVIVVDNNSNDETVKIIKEKFHNTEIISLKKNVGFGMANNIGIKRALFKKANFIFLLNQDAWIESNTIEKLLITLKQNNSPSPIGIISPVHLNGTGNLFDKGFYRYLSKDFSRSFFSKLFLSNNSLDSFYPSNFINAAAWLINSECLLNIGGFNPIFFHYGEDCNYVHRLQFLGYSIGFSPNAIIFHDRENSPERSGKTWDSYYLHYLINACNINEPLSKNFLKYSLIYLSEAFYNLFSGKFFDSKNYWFAFLKILTSLIKVKKNRQMAKIKGAFLNTDS